MLPLGLPRGDSPATLMPVEERTNLLVTGHPVSTGLRVRGFDRLEVTSTGRVNFGGAFGPFLSTAVLDADGDNWETPPNYPAPALGKNSLLVAVRSRGGWANDEWTRFYQGGVNRTVVPGDPGEVFLLANDASPGDNTDGWSVTVRRHFPDSTGPPRLAIDRVELVQSIQRYDNSVPLLSGKQLVVRVYPAADGLASIAHVTGRCRARLDDGTMLTGELLSSDGSSRFVTARRRGAQFRDDPSSSLNFLFVPPVVGGLDVTAEVWVDGQQGQPGRSATSHVATTVQASAPFAVLPFLVALPMHGLAEPTAPAALNVLWTALSRWPFGSDRTTILPARRWTFGLRLDSFFGWQNLVYQLGSPLHGALYATRVAFCMDIGTSTNGMAMYRPWIAVPACVSTISGRRGVDVTACAHELGHTIGLNHADACGAGIPHSSRLPRRTEEPGWRPDPDGVVPAGVAEVMSYCDAERFPSIAAYEYALLGRHR